MLILGLAPSEVHSTESKGKVLRLAGVSLQEEPASYQLVGEVMAHQGYDG